MSLRRNRVKDLSFSAGDSEEIPLTTLRKLRRLVFDFVGVLSVVGGAANGSLVEDGVLRTILKKIELLADGNTIVDTDGRALYWLRAIMSGSQGVLVEPGVTVGDHAVRFHVELDFDQIATAAKFAGRINTDLLDSLDLRITMGNPDGEIITGGDRAEALVGVLEIVAEYDDKEWKGSHRRIAFRRYQNAGATTDARVTVPTGELISHILLVAVDNGVRDQAIVNRIKAMIGEDNVVRDVSWEELQGENVEDFGLELSSGLPPYAGLAVLFFDKDGDMNPDKLWDTRNLKQNAATLRFDINAPTGQSYVEANIFSINPAASPKKA